MVGDTEDRFWKADELVEQDKSKPEYERVKADQEKAKVEALKLELLLAQVQQGQNITHWQLGCYISSLF
jgi:hypothetical protein